MKRFLIPLVTTLFVIPACYAGVAVKCSNESGVTYQATPCTEGVAAVWSLPPAANATAQAAANEDEASAAPRPGPTAGPFPPGRIAVPATGPAPPGAAPVRVTIHSRRDELQTGMSDLEVLNNRRWGKPQRITRNRDARAWHEHWNYDTGANGGKQLHFVNGTLAGIEDIGYAAPAISMASVVMVGAQ